MKNELRYALVVIAVVIFGYIAYARRFEITAMIWHWRYGDFVQVGKYEMPVPNQWLVKVEPSGLTLLTDIRNRQGMTGLSGINVITVDSLPRPTTDLMFWKSQRAQWLKTNGIADIEEKTIDFEDETVSCVGGHEFQQLMRLPDTGTVVSLDCLSSGSLHLMFVGQRPDLDLFYSLIPKIRKQK